MFRVNPNLVALKELVFIAVGLLPFAFCINQVLVPHAVIGGGLTGVAEMIYFFSQGAMPIWLTTLVINALLLGLAIWLVGWRFCLRTIYGVCCLSLWLKLIPIPEESIITDPFMGVVLAGLINGVGLGIVFLNNGSSGGTDIVAMIANKRRHLPLGRVLLACDIIVISSAWCLPEVTKVSQLLLGLCYTIITTSAVDWVMGRLRQSVQFFIFTRHHEEVKDAILHKADRGLTLLEGEGGYSGQPMKVLTVLARRSDQSKLLQVIREADAEAFVSVFEVRGVYGQGFQSMSR